MSESDDAKTARIAERTIWPWNDEYGCKYVLLNANNPAINTAITVAIIFTALLVLALPTQTRLRILLSSRAH